MAMKAGTDSFVDAVEAGLRQAGVDFDWPLLIAFSGGPDSSALLLACVALRDRHEFDFTAAHFDHRLRGVESERDALQAEAVCRRYGVECVSGSGETLDRSRQTGRSLEAAARELRYAFLADAASAAGTQAVATGHTMDDQAETVLLNITRGAGLRGVAAMRSAVDLPVAGRTDPLRVVRPMLGVRKSEAAEFCRQNGLAPLLDHSNEDTRFPRNKLRRDVVPVLESINPNFVEAVCRLARSARDDFEVIDSVSAVAFNAAVTTRDGGAELSKEAVRKLPVPVARRVLMAAFESVSGTLDGLESAHVDAMLEVAAGRAGMSADLAGGVTIAGDRKTARLARRERLNDDCPYPPVVPDVVLPVPGELDLSDGFRLVAEIRSGATPEAGREWTAALDPGIVDGPLVVRSRRPGDRFHPLGMPGPVKLQDFFVNAGVPRRWRDRVPLVESKAGIAWVAGHRPAEWARLGPAADRALRLELTVPG